MYDLLVALVGLIVMQTGFLTSPQFELEFSLRH